MPNSNIEENAEEFSHISEARHSLVPTDAEIVAEPVEDALVAFREHPTSKGDSEAHVEQVMRRLRRIMYACEDQIMADLVGVRWSREPVDDTLPGYQFTRIIVAHVHRHLPKAENEHRA